MTCSLKSVVVLKLISTSVLMMILLLGWMPVQFNPHAFAAELFVSPGGTGTACTEGNPCALQTALDTAEENEEADSILLFPGTYGGNFEYRAPSSESYSLTIKGVIGTSAEEVILDGQNNGRVLDLYRDPSSLPPNFDVRVREITVSNGNTTSEGRPEGAGIKIIVHDASVYLTDCIIKNCTAKGQGGGIWVNPSGDDFFIENNLVFNNTVEEAFGPESRGGGAFLMIPGGSAVVRNNVFAGNTAQGASSQGGGLFMGWSGTCTQHIIGNTIYDNYAYYGAGIYFFDAWTSNVYNNVIYSNTGVLSGDDIYFRDGYVPNRSGYNNNYSVMYGSWTSSGNNMDVDPLLKDPAGDDFHLQGQSAMINAGTADVPEPPGLPDDDFEGNPRVFGSAPDIGADEYLCALVPQLQILLLND